tara:strand:- start:116 stop:649 length:534 start_codon:yes stop_codon:yes gene_type:complete
MVNWKSKYLEMKLKYINAKNKINGGANPIFSKENMKRVEAEYEAFKKTQADLKEYYTEQQKKNWEKQKEAKAARKAAVAKAAEAKAYFSSRPGAAAYEKQLKERKAAMKAAREAKDEWRDGRHIFSKENMERVEADYEAFKKREADLKPWYIEQQKKNWEKEKEKQRAARDAAAKQL